MTTTEAWEQETEQSWVALEQRLATWLEWIPPDEAVVIEMPWPDGGLEGAAPYVQLTVDEVTVRSEAASNRYLDERFRLDGAREAALVDLGWIQPDAEESDNFWREDEIPDGSADLAARLVSTLREVYGVPAPAFLVTRGFTDEGPLAAEELPFGLTISLPAPPKVDLTITVPEGADDLRDLVAEALSTAVDISIEFDADGDIPVPAASTVVYVRVDEDAPSVTLFSAALCDVRWTPRVGHTLNDVNKTIRYGRAVFTGSHVMLEHRLFCWPFVPELLRYALVAMLKEIDDLAIDLQQRIGGSLLRDHQDGVA